MATQPAVNRVSLPSEFYDITNAKMLVTPTPEMPYAQMAMTALGLSLEVPEDISNAGREPFPTHGAPYMTLEDLQLKLNQNPIFAQTVIAETNFSASFGATMRFNRASFANTSSYTLAQRIVGPNTTLTTTPIGVQGEQTALTLVRIAGPYDSDNSRVAPIAIESFDANMSVHKLVQVAGLTLQYDFHRTLEGCLVTLLDLGTAIYPGKATADSDFTSTDSYPMDVETIRRAEATANKANIPTFPGGFRVAMLDPIQVLQLQSDIEYQRQAQFMPEFNVLQGAYVKSISKTHIFQSSTLTATSNSTVYVSKGHYFGPQCLLVGMGRPPRVRTASDDNYEETPKVLWLGDMAFGLADSRFVYTLRSATAAV